MTVVAPWPYLSPNDELWPLAHPKVMELRRVVASHARQESAPNSDVAVVLTAMRYYVTLSTANERLVSELAFSAKESGASWSDIAEAAGVSRQALQKGRRSADQASEERDAASVEVKSAARTMRELVVSEAKKRQKATLDKLELLLEEIGEATLFRAIIPYEIRKLGLEAKYRGAAGAAISAAWGVSRSTAQEHLANSDEILNYLLWDLALAAEHAGIVARDERIDPDLAEVFIVWLEDTDRIFPLDVLRSVLFSQAKAMSAAYAAMPITDYEKIQRAVEHRIGKSMADDIFCRNLILDR